MKLLVATNNPAKEKQFRWLFQGRPEIELLFLRDVNLAGLRAEEDGVTALENALKKSRFFAQKSRLATLGDDAGVEIDALGGEPGVRARRWGGKLPEGADDETWLSYFLEKTKNIPQENRGGKIRASWAAVFPDGTELTMEIIRPIFLLKAPQRPYPKGDPLSAVSFDIRRNKVAKDLKNEERYEILKEELDHWDAFWQKVGKKS